MEGDHSISCFPEVSDMLLALSVWQVHYKLYAVLCENMMYLRRFIMFTCKMTIAVDAPENPNKQNYVYFLY